MKHACLLAKRKILDGLTELASVPVLLVQPFIKQPLSLFLLCAFI